jgi:hypothetical protein
MKNEWVFKEKQSSNSNIGRGETTISAQTAAIIDWLDAEDDRIKFITGNFKLLPRLLGCSWEKADEASSCGLYE